MAEFWETDELAQPPWEADEVVSQTGTKTEGAFRRFVDRNIRGAALAGRTVAEGAIDVIAPLSNPAAYIANQAAEKFGGGRPFPEDLSGQFSQTLTDMGVPAPLPAGEDDWIGETAINMGGRFASGMATGTGLSNAVMGRMGAAQSAVNAPTQPVRQTASSRPAQTLLDEGVPLDAAQRSGGRFSNMLRSALHNHPFTVDKQAAFSQTQNRAFTRAVLRSIGVNADEATQSVMQGARRRIGLMFDRVGIKGTKFDTNLQDDIARIVDDASATVPQSELAPLTKNIDDLLAAVDDADTINGKAFVRIRSRLSNLSRRPGIGEAASDLESALLSSLERTHPGQRQLLRDAVDQWRNMRIIQSAIGKGAERDISPLRLSNALATKANQNMSVYGLGGDQRLVELAQAGRSVLPQALPDSGTIPRGLMVAPIRAVTTAPGYKFAQSIMNRQQPGSGVLRPEVFAATQAAASAAYPRESERSESR